MKFKKLFISVISLLFLLTSASSVLADPNSISGATAKQTSAFMTTAGFSQTAQAEGIISVIIRLVLSFLAVIFVILMIFSGYQWMTAGGNDEQVKKAQARIKNAVIGLVVVILAYAITAFVFKNLPKGPQTVTGGGSGQNVNP